MPHRSTPPARSRAASPAPDGWACVCSTLCIYKVRFEWDDAKDRANRKKHGVEFELAVRVFADECCLIVPDRVDEETGEQRWHAIGRVEGLAIYTVVHVYREGKPDDEEIIRIVSAREADQRERRRYLQQAAY